MPSNPRSRDRVPDSTLLSHDLFEGIFARAGLASDIEVVEEFPARYDVGALRHHRWARGDWQLLPWILGRALLPANANRTFGHIPAIGRWKMLDNLRRTLSAPAGVIALLAGWAMPFNAALIWTIFILSTIVLPTLIPVVAAIQPRPPRDYRRQPFASTSWRSPHRSALSLLIIAFQAHQSWLMGDAIIRTLYRLFISRPASARMGARRTGRNRPPARLLRLLSLDGRCDRHSGVGCDHPFIGRYGGWMLIATPMVVLWLASPAIARWVSLSPHATDDCRYPGAMPRCCG